MYRMSHKDCIRTRERIERRKLNRKVLYHFVIFAIIIKILIKKNWLINAHFARLDHGIYALDVSAA